MREVSSVTKLYCRARERACCLRAETVSSSSGVGVGGGGGGGGGIIESHTQINHDINWG